MSPRASASGPRSSVLAARPRRAGRPPTATSTMSWLERGRLRRLRAARALPAPDRLVRGAPMLLVGLVLAGWAVVRFMRPRPSTAEKEPNDLAAMATLLPRDKPVSGHVGEPRPSGEPDFDYYRIPAGKGTRAVTAKITGVPDVDLVLELYDGDGQAGGPRRTTRAKGEGESLGPAAIGAGRGLRARPPGLGRRASTPAAGSSTPYELTVDWGRPRPDWELEPNERPAAANPIEKESAVSGFLAAPEDQDWFLVKVPAGMRVDGRVDGIDGIDLIVLLGDGARSRIDTAGVGEHEPFTHLPGKDGTVLVGIAEQPVKQTGKKTPPPADRDEPYTLKLKFRPDDHARPLTPPGRANDSLPMRPDGRRPDELRPVRITPDYTRYAEGSVLVEFGETKVICTATVESKVPPFLEGQRPGLGHRRIRHVAALDPHPLGPQPGRPRPGDPAPDRAGAARRRRPEERWARARSPSTAT